MTTPTSDIQRHHSAEDARRDHAYLASARERGWITLEEIMHLASGSPVDAGEAVHVAREAGIDMADHSDESPWDDSHGASPGVFHHLPAQWEAALFAFR